MEIKQSTKGEILDFEKEAVLHGAERYGDYFINANEFNQLLNEFIRSVDPDRFIFAMFLSQVRKHHTLALFSVVRLHHIQGMLNLRQTIEAGASAAYAIANTDQKDFADTDEAGILDPTKELAVKRYKWLEKYYPAGSTPLKNLKNSINESPAHANIVYAQQNFRFNARENRFETPFFDIEDEYLVKSDLWFVGNIAMGLADLFYGVSKDFGGVKFVDDFPVRLKQLGDQNHALKAELMKNPRFVRAQAKASESQ